MTLTLTEFIKAKGLTSVAKGLGVRPNVVANWRKRESVPVDMCHQLITMSNGALKYQALRPKDSHLIWPSRAKKIGQGDTVKSA